MGMHTGRPSTGRAKAFGKLLLEGLDTLGTVMNDGPKLERIKEIDKQIADLRQERDHLIVGLEKSYDGVQLSEDYDPNWRKDEPTKKPVEVNGGLLVHCAGRDTMSVRHTAHPGCPYVGQYHTEHDFILKD